MQTQRVSALEEENARLHTEIEEARCATSYAFVLHSEYENARRIIEGLQTEKENLEGQLRTTENVQKGLVQELSSVNRQLDALRSKCAEQQATMEQLQKAFKAEQVKCEQLRQMSCSDKEAANENHELKQALIQAYDACSKMATASELKASEDALALKHALEANRSLESELASLQASMQNEKEQARQQQEALRQELAASKRQDSEHIGVLELQNATYRQDFAAERRSREEMHMNLEEKLTEVQDLTKRCTELEEELRNKTHELAEMRQLEEMRHRHMLPQQRTHAGYQSTIPQRLASSVSMPSSADAAASIPAVGTPQQVGMSPDSMFGSSLPSPHGGWGVQPQSLMPKRILVQQQGSIESCKCPICGVLLPADEDSMKVHIDDCLPPDT